MPSHPNLPVDYLSASPMGRITFELAENGFTIFMPSVGMWRRSRWGLLVALLLIVLPAEGLAIVDPSLVTIVPQLIGSVSKPTGHATCCEKH